MRLNNLITDIVFVAFKVYHHMKTRGYSSRSLMSLKLDMAKAYDKVELSFPEAIMLCLGFAPVWVSLMQIIAGMCTVPFDPRGYSSWVPLLPGLIKLNTDVGILVPDRIQVGVIFRDEFGMVLAPTLKVICGSWALDVSEAMLFQSRECSNNGLGFVLQDCVEFVHNLINCSWTYVRWLGNALGHALAKYQFDEGSGHEKVCIEDVPSDVAHSVSQDLSLL
ncbi:uncharacterized protein LOC131181390 [Hevea brasiliensis]|uniref:uncharacterized protein LOC131181390 n=1 Tax=Hevea brasiliensis TaxID=3981 RepID=UPI0025FD8E57|nr:uncharacterized protein LOC131181390 [Hevea brasiliensis]